MPPGRTRERIALDTNLALDLADGYGFRPRLQGNVPEQRLRLVFAADCDCRTARELLVTSDKHLLEIDETALKVAFAEADLPSVSPLHPKRLLRALR